MSRRLLRWTPVVVWMAVIFYMSSLSQLPSVAPPTWQEALSNVAHFGEYAVLGGLLWRALLPLLRQPWPHWAALLIGLLYAVSDEFHQSFVPNRQSSLTDLAVDAVGLALAQIAVLVWQKRRDRRHLIA